MQSQEVLGNPVKLKDGVSSHSLSGLCFSYKHLNFPVCCKWCLFRLLSLWVSFGVGQSSLKNVKGKLSQI